MKIRFFISMVVICTVILLIVFVLSAGIPTGGGM